MMFRDALSYYNISITTISIHDSAVLILDDEISQ